MVNNMIMQKAEEKRLNYFYAFGLLHLAFILISMTVTARMISVSYPPNISFLIPGGVFLVPGVFFIQDIVTEIYGYYNARRMLFTSLLLFIIYGLLLYCIARLNFAPSVQHDNLLLVADSLPRQMLSFTISLAIGGTINNYVLSKLKLALHSKFLALRFISATAIGEFVFQCSAVLIAWHGIYSIRSILPIAIASYVYKILFEVASIPLNIYVCTRLKSIK